MPKRKRVPVTMRALIQRINRVKDTWDVLKKRRGEAGRADLGDYYVIDVNRNAIVNTHVDPEQLGRKLGVLREWEELAK